MASIPLLQIDAFTDQPFRGNPAAVCLLGPGDKADAAWMQAVAAEMNLSETAFLRKAADGFELRWFTPKVEVDLCGHATLAAAHALWTTGAVEADQTIRFHTRSGVLTATRSGGFIELDFPAAPAEECPPPPGLLEATGIGTAARQTFVGKTRFDKFLVVGSAAEVRDLAPDFRRLAAIATRGIVVTAASDDERFDFVSRFFAPAAGIDEDPVTGSAHCSLAPYWSGQLGKAELVGYQASARGGVVKTRLAGDRVILSGQAVTVLRGELV